MGINIAICSAGFRPIPDVQGGAVEHLVTNLIEENERYGRFFFDVFTVSDSKLNSRYYSYTKLIQIQNRQHILPIRALFSIVNRTCNVLHLKKHFDYMSVVLPLAVRKKYDLIVVENNLHMFFSLKRRYPKAQIIFHIHNDFDTVDTDYDKTQDRIVRLGKQATAIWTASSYLKKHISSVTHADQIQVLENCISRKMYCITDGLKAEALAFREENSLTKNDLVILFSGRLDRWKGALELLEAVALLPSNLNLKVLLAGGQWFASKEEQKYERKLDKIIAGIAGKVIKCGSIPQKKMPKIYAAADVVVIPSQGCEAFGMTALEAITMGKPCIASGCGGLLDVLDDSCAMLIPQGKQFVTDLAKAIEYLYHNQFKLSQLAAGALIKAEQFNDERKYYEKFTQLVKESVVDKG